MSSNSGHELGETVVNVSKIAGALRELFKIALALLVGAGAVILWFEQRITREFGEYEILQPQGLLNSESGRSEKSDGILIVHANGTNEGFYVQFEVKNQSDWVPVTTTQTVSGQLGGSFTVPVTKKQTWRLTSNVKNQANITINYIPLRSNW